MAHIDPTPSTAPVTGVAEPHQSTVAAILRAVEQGLFTAAQADMLIDRVRAHVTALPVTLPVVLQVTAAPVVLPTVAVPVSVADSYPPTGGYASVAVVHQSG